MYKRQYQRYEDNQWLQQVVEAARQQTKDTLRPLENITRTTGFNVPMGGGKKVFTPLSEYLERSLDKGMMGIVTGTKTYSQAIGDVIDEMTASGVRTVDYASGKSDRIEVAARRAVMTGVAVSYTHLDVYKRQVQRESSITIKITLETCWTMWTKI